MHSLLRYQSNPIIFPESKNVWEKEAAFNPSIIQFGKEYRICYRAMSSPKDHFGNFLEISSIGVCSSKNRVSCNAKKQFIKPDKNWDRFGCEDPRVTFFEGKYYIFYTALGGFPFSWKNIRCALAKTLDFKKIEYKKLVTPFNSKAMCLFPKRINGKGVLILSVDTDKPPTYIALRYFDREEDLFDKKKWLDWYAEKRKHELKIQRGDKDHIEVGSCPVLTDKGWLLVYSYIKNYGKPYRNFAVKACLLDRNNPGRVIADTKEPLLMPFEKYEMQGKVGDIVFPTSVLVHNGELGVYYGASDTSSCLATMRLSDLYEAMGL